MMMERPMLPDDTIEDPVEQRECVREIHDCLSQLPREYRLRVLVGCIGAAIRDSWPEEQHGSLVALTNERIPFVVSRRRPPHAFH